MLETNKNGDKAKNPVPTGEAATVTATTESVGHHHVQSLRLPDLQIWEVRGVQPTAGPIPLPLAAASPVQVFVLQGAAMVAAQQCPAHTHGAWWPGPQATHLQAEAGQQHLLALQWQAGALRAPALACGSAWQAFARATAQPHPSALFPSPAPIDLPLQTALQDLLRNWPLASRNATFALAKALEIMALQEEAWCQSQERPVIHARSDYDRERIRYAHDYLLAHMAMPPSLRDLAEIAGINEFKLKKGFKELYGTTVFGMLAEARLQKAHELLQIGRKSATEVAFELGYASLQHFSARFSERFGVRPTALSRRRPAPDSQIVQG